MGGLLGKIWDKTTDALHAVTGMPTADEKRNQQRMITDQIQAYKDQTELSRKAIDETRAQKDIEKRKINEKQIRSLRNNYRPQGGFLNNQGNSAPGATSPLLGSGNTGISDKLGA